MTVNTCENWLIHMTYCICDNTLTTKEWPFFMHLIEYIEFFAKYQSDLKLIRYFFIVYIIWLLLKTMNEDKTLRYLDFLSTNLRSLWKSTKWTTKKFIDYATCSISLFFSKYFLNYNNCRLFFLYPQWEIGML